VKPRQRPLVFEKLKDKVAASGSNAHRKDVKNNGHGI
jgi:hypothetical protein